MDNEGGDGEAAQALERLGAVVHRRTNAAVWRAFLVAQVSVRTTGRRREMTTQRLFLTTTR